MVQRATQTAIWAMPGVALVDFTKATKRDLGGKMNDVVYLTKPLNSNHGFLTANDGPESKTFYKTWSLDDLEKASL
jgi:hypothetical protein